MSNTWANFQKMGKKMLKTCPECEKIFSGKKCECGYQQANKKFSAHHPDALKCCWMLQDGSRCQNIGTIAPDPYAGLVDEKKGEKYEDRKFYCSWHYECLLDKNFEKDSEAQERFHKRIATYKRN